MGAHVTSPLVDDPSVIVRVGAGDETALRELMDRHDRLIRFTIFRLARDQCVRDPQWLDAVASESWNGFVAAARKGVELRSNAIAGYLVGIARQQTISALRRLRAFVRIPQDDLSDFRLTQIESTELDPESLATEIELLHALRKCAAKLEDADRVILSQLGAIMQRKWVEASAALGLSESTLRSRWARILDRLRDCLEKKSR